MSSIHFSDSEFACQCGCGQCIINQELLDVLEGLRDYYNSPVTITSGNRCAAHNAEVGGAKSSRHITGEAADVTVLNVPAAAVHAYFMTKYPTQYGIGKYTAWTHIDVRDTMARW